MNFFLTFLIVFAVSLPAYGSTEEQSRQERRKTVLTREKQKPAAHLRAIKKTMALERNTIKQVERKVSGVISQVEDIKKIIERQNIVYGEMKQKEKHISTHLDKLKKEEGKIESDIQKQRVKLVRMMRNIFPYRKNAIMNYILGQDSKSLFFRKIQLLKIIAEKDAYMIAEYSDKVRLLKKKRNEYQLKVEGLTEVKKRLERRRVKIIKKKENKDKLLIELQNKVELSRSSIEELEEVSKKLEEMLGVLRKASREDVVSTLSGNFAKGKGLFNWPIIGKILVNFGEKRDKVSGLKFTNKGIIIKSVPGMSVRAIFRGKVMFADWFKGYEKLVIINHDGGYYTSYGYLSQIEVRENDLVENGEIIGLTGVTNSLKTPSLYFELRKGGNVINPLPWLKKKE